MGMSKKSELLLLILLPLVSTLVILWLKLNFLYATLLMFGPPSLWLLSRKKSQGKKIALFSLLFSLPFVFIFDYFISKDHGWYIVSSLFPLRLFNLVTLEQFFWGYFYAFYLVVFYEHFLDKKAKQHKEVISQNMKFFSKCLAIGLFFFIGIAVVSPTVLELNYAYLVLGSLFGILPLLLFLLRYPYFLKRFLLAASYFASIAVLNEYVGLSLNHWIFPGTHYIGLTSFFGHTIPVEEVVLYFFLCAPIVLSYYEFFDDDRK